MNTIEALNEMFLQPISPQAGDSGSIYGYLYEKRAKNGISEEEFIIDSSEKIVDLDEIYYNTYYLFKENLDFLEKETKLVREQGLSVLSDRYEELDSEYTYNLGYQYSDDFIFHIYENMFSEYIVVIQLHNGCDARAGFSRPYVFMGDMEIVAMCSLEDLKENIERREEEYNIKIKTE